jgi:hypothetical protein
MERKDSESSWRTTVANLNAEQLRRLARLGAMARLTQIREEEAAIRDEFPELFGHGIPKPTRSKGGRQRKTKGRK